MDKRLQLIAHLYEEDLEGLEPLDTLLQDPDLDEEYRTLRESRFRLDHRHRVRPDVSAIDAIVTAASPRPGLQRRWIDRTPLRLVRQKRLLAPAMAVAAVILVAIAIRPWSFTDPIGTAPQLAAEDEGSMAAAESLLRALPPAPSPAAPVAELSLADAEKDAASDLSSWDSGRDLRQLSRRIAVLRASGIDEWDGEAVPLEMLPSSSGPTDLVPAGTRPPGQ